MAAKDQFATSSHAEIYSRYRQDIPGNLIETIMSFLTEKYDGPLDIAVDVGCGSGQSTIVFAPMFKQVYGMDVSEAQIAEAKKSRTAPNVSYSVAEGEKLDSFADSSVQLISASSVLHWLNMDVFFDEAHRVLCNNGVLAVYCYYRLKPVVNADLMEKVDDLYNEFYELIDNYLAPQAKIALAFYEDVKFPFKEIARFNDVVGYLDGDISDIVGYAKSNSGFQNLMKEEKDLAENFIESFESRMKQILKESNINPDGPLKLSRSFVLILCRHIK